MKRARERTVQIHADGPEILRAAVGADFIARVQQQVVVAPDACCRAPSAQNEPHDEGAFVACSAQQTQRQWKKANKPQGHLPPG